MKINLYGLFYCMKHEVLAMEANGGGAIDYGARASV